jgi:proline iminopeptidase
LKKWSACLAVVALVMAYGCKRMGTQAEFPVSEGFVTVEEGVDLRYKTVGDGPETIVIPAAIYLEYELEKLADDNRTLIFYDMRGRGKSSQVTERERISMDIEISDLEKLRQHLGKDKISLIGWSYLGGVVFLYASQYPENVERIIQIGPISPTFEIYSKTKVDPLDKEDLAKLKKMQEEGLAESDPEVYCTEFWNIYMKQIFFDNTKIGLFRSDVCQCENEMRERVTFQLQAVIQSIGHWDWIERARNLNVPVLTIQGDSDTLPVEGARMWASSLPDARLLIVPEAGHLPMVEQPEIFFPAVDTFLDGGWPAEAELIEGNEE